MKFAEKHIALGLLILCLASVWIYRFASLNDPYFWDEMGVYGNGVQYLLKNGISLFPNAMPADISRGHPLLFYALHASVLNIFGNTFFVSHAFALVLSSLCLVATYYLAQEFMSKLLAAFAVILLASQNIFLAQSTLVIPEISIALLSTLSLLAFLKKKYFWMAIFLSIGVLMKESVIIIGAFLGALFLLEKLLEGNLKSALPKLLPFTLPLIVLLIFLEIQYLQNGWYFFPYHTDIVKEGAFNGFFERLEMHYHFLLFKQGRNQWLIALALSFVALLFAKEKRKLAYLLIFVLFNVVLFSLAFYMDRYLLYIYPVLCILVVYAIGFVTKQHKILLSILCVLLIVFSSLSHKDPAFRIDASLAYQDVVEVHLDALSYFCKLADEETKYSSNFPINMSMWNDEFGYINSDCMQKIRIDDQNPDYLIYFETVDPNKALIYSSVKNNARVSIYKN